MNPRRKSFLMIIFKIFTRCGARTMLFRPGPHAITMAKAKTGEFWLTETIQLPAASASGTRVMGTIDLGAYVDVGDRQSIEISFVDYIWQQSDDYSSDPGGMVAGNATLGAQISDLNPNTLFTLANHNALISSAALSIDQPNNISSHSSDFYPDDFKGEGKFVVNDTLYVVAGVDGNAIGAQIVYCTVRCRVKIVTLSMMDYMGLAVQSTASDN